MPSHNATLQHQLFHATFFLERLAYYGMRALLVLYLIQDLELSNADTFSYYGTFTIAAYILAMPAGLFSDLVFNRKIGAIIGSGLACVGYLFLFMNNSLTFTFIALGLIALGTAFFRTSVLALLSEYAPRKSVDRTKTFVINYLLINLGATLGVMLIGLVGEKLGFRLGFGAAGVVLLLALGLLLWAVKLGDFSAETTMDIDFSTNTLFPENILDAPLSKGSSLSYRETELNVFHYLLMLGIPIIIGLFWGAFEQTSHIFNAIVRDGFEVLGMTFQGSSYYALNGFLTVGGCLLFFVYLHQKRTFSNLISIGIGFLIAVLALVFTYMLSSNMSDPSATNAVLLVTILFGIAEVLIAPISIAFMTRISPPKFTATFIGLYFLITGGMNKLFSLLNDAGLNFYGEDLLIGIFIVVLTLGGVFLIGGRSLLKKDLNGID